MKLFLIRYTKLVFIWLQLHRVFNFFSGAIANLFWLTKFSKWAYENRKVAYNDFPSKWDYYKRNNMYKWVIEKEKLKSFAFTQVGLEVSIKQTDANARKNPTYARLDLGNRFGWKVHLLQSVATYQ